VTAAASVDWIECCVGVTIGVDVATWPEVHHL